MLYTNPLPFSKAYGAKFATASLGLNIPTVASATLDWTTLSQSVSHGPASRVFLALMTLVRLLKSALGEEV